MPGRRFFISYAHEHGESEELLAELKWRLAQRGHQVLDDTDIPLGADWEHELTRRIRECDVFIVLVCAKSVTSREVRKEIDRAEESRTHCGRPTIVPIRVRYDEPIADDLQKILATRQWFAWRDPAYTLQLVNLIDKTAALLPPRPEAEPGPAETSAPSTPRRNATVLRTRALMAAAAVAVVVGVASAPILLLRWRARTLIESTSRYDVDRGLVLSALSSAFVASQAPEEARRIYREQHYPMLLATIRGDVLMSGREIAVSPGGTPSIVGGGSRRECAADWTCAPAVAFADVPIEDAAFVSPSVVLTRDFDGVVLRNDLLNGTRSPFASGTTALAAEGGEVALGFATTPFVRVYDRDDSPTAPAGVTGPVRSVAFGPCRSCISILGEDGRVAIWNRSNGSVAPLRGAPRPATHIAGTAAEARLAVMWNDRTVTFHDASQTRVTSSRVDADPAKITRMIMAEDGRDVALVHDGEITLVGAGGELPLVSGELKPEAVAAAFARGVLFTRTPSEVRVWSRDRSLLGHERAPADGWRKWRKQFGLTFRDLRAGPGDPLGP